jgi:hypothetical protein
MSKARGVATAWGPSSAARHDRRLSCRTGSRRAGVDPINGGAGGTPPAPIQSRAAVPAVFPLQAPCRVHATFAGPAADRPVTFPVTWAIRVEDVPSARVAVGCLMDRPVAHLELVFDPRGGVYVQWTE